MGLDQREHAAILAAVRLLQDALNEHNYGGKPAAYADVLTIATDDGAFAPMTYDEIVDLRERLKTEAILILDSDEIEWIEEKALEEEEYMLTQDLAPDGKPCQSIGRKVRAFKE